MYYVAACRAKLHHKEAAQAGCSVPSKSEDHKRSGVKLPGIGRQWIDSRQLLAGFQNGNMLEAGHVHQGA